MPRLSIDISADEHRQLKAIAALSGKTIKDYVLERTLHNAPSHDGQSAADAIEALAAFLNERMAQANRGQLSTKTVDDIRAQARAKAGL